MDAYVALVPLRRGIAARGLSAPLPYFVPVVCDSSSGAPNNPTVSGVVSGNNIKGLISREPAVKSSISGNIKGTIGIL